MRAGKSSRRVKQSFELLWPAKEADKRTAKDSLDVGVPSNVALT